MFVPPNGVPPAQPSMNLPFHLREPDAFEASLMQQTPHVPDDWLTLVVPCLQFSLVPGALQDGTPVLAFQASGVIPVDLLRVKFSGLLDAQGNTRLTNDTNPLFQGPGGAQIAVVVRATQLPPDAVTAVRADGEGAS